MPEDTESRAAADLLEAVESYYVAMDWTRSDMPITDVVVITVRRGFDANGGKTNVVCVTPTDTPVPMALGMTTYAQEWFKKMIHASFDNQED